MATQYKNVTDKAVKQIGSASSVARHFKFKSVQSVCNWIIKDQVPSERVLELCRLGAWRVTPHQLRPDLYPNFTDGLPDEMKSTTCDAKKVIYENQP